MTDAEMIAWIDNASYEALLSRWRFASVGDPFFRGAVGDHYVKALADKKAEVGQEEHARASKAIGWSRT